MPKKKRKKVVDLPPPEPIVVKKGAGTIVYFDRNPFINKMEVTVKEKKILVAKANYGYIVNDDGELELQLDNGQIVSLIPVDNEKFTKIFVDKMASFADLSNAAHKTLLIFFYFLPKRSMGSDTIKLSFRDYQAKKDLIGVKISKRTFERGVKELIEKQFLARTDTPNFYWLNPNKFFAGNRVTFIESYIKVEEFEKLKPILKEKLGLKDEILEEQTKELESFPIPENE